MRTYVLRGIVLVLAASWPADGLAQSEALVQAYTQGLAHYQTGRYGEATPFWVKALELGKREFGPEDPTTATFFNNLALLYYAQGRHNDAEPLYKRALAIQEKVLGPDHPDVATGLNNLAVLYRAQGRNADAEPLFKRALAIREKALGPQHAQVAQSLNNLAALYDAQGRHKDAEPLFKRALAMREKALGRSTRKSPPASTTSPSCTVSWAATKTPSPSSSAPWPSRRRPSGRTIRMSPPASTTWPCCTTPRAATKTPSPSSSAPWPSTRRHSGRSTRKSPPASTASHGCTAPKAVMPRRSTPFGGPAQFFAAARRAPAGNAPAAASASREPCASFFVNHIRIAWEVSERDAGERASLAAEGFEAAQLASATSTARAVAGMAARFGAGDDALGRVVRARQDAAEEWRRVDEALTKAAGRLPDKRDRAAEAMLRTRLADLDRRLGDLDARLAKEFPDYAELASPRPAPLAETQALLAADEALLAYLVTSKKTFLWVLRGEAAQMHRLDIGAKALAAAVAKLRRGLDPTARSRGLNTKAPRRGQSFERSTAFELYRRIFAPAEPLLGGIRHLLVVPDGALQSLPLGVLITEEPQGEFEDFSGYRQVPWLARKYAMTTLPSVSSLGALRRFAKAARARKAFLGIGDPLLEGHPQEGRGVEIAALFTARGGADVREVRALPALPETADELKALAKALGAGDDSVLLRENATEGRVRTTDLSDYRVLAFATHGLVAGDLEGLAEPALVLTPPATATADDDGLLTASEVAMLKLDADWVILSACNTAAADGTPGADGLSGLAKAFFYAGSRALLVSHWPVVSEAAVKLTTAMLKFAADHPEVGRAEALRYSMLALLADDAKPRFAHPMFWAPFVVVGEGERILRSSPDHDQSATGALGFGDCSNAVSPGGGRRPPDPRARPRPVLGRRPP